MTEQPPAERPGHLDIDAVSAFVDRDLESDDLTTIELHLHECPACHREVLEIRTTVVLLAGLPQYTPRRSFCLGHEHVSTRARRRGRAVAASPWSGPIGSTRYPAAAAAGAAASGGRGAGWLPGLQAAAMVIGAMLLLVTSSDLMGMPPQPAEWLSGSDVPAPQVSNLSAPAPETALPAQAPAMEESVASDQAGGTASDDSASEEVLTGAAREASAPAMATSAALAAVTQAAPTSAAGLARQPESAAEGGAPVSDIAEPSRLRVVQIALAFALAWLVVSIVGLRWVRGLR